jgi:hypothetical protein
LLQGHVFERLVGERGVEVRVFSLPAGHHGYATHADDFHTAVVSAGCL